MRTRNAMLNFVTSYSFYFIAAIFGFIKVSVFIKYLGEQLYSLNQIYINMFQYISILEAGIGGALVYRLYKLMVEKDFRKVNQLCAGTKKILRIIGGLIVILGFLVSFIIPIFIKEDTYSMTYINITFMLYIIKNSIDYFMFTPQFIIQADQKMYKINVIIYIFRIIEVALEVLIILGGFDYLIMLIPGIFIRLISNTIINRRIYKEYPWFENSVEKDISVKSDINNLFVHRIVGLVFNNIDMVIISTFLGAFYVTVYSVYNYIVRYTTDTIYQIFNAIKDGIGNVINTETKEDAKIILDQVFTMFDFFSVVLVLGFYFVLNKFVAVWVGNEYIVDFITLNLFLFLIYYNINIKSSELIKNALGLYRETKKIAVIGAVLNLGLSLALVNLMGLKGVLLATSIASVCTDMWYLPYITSKVLYGTYSPTKLLIHLKNFLFIVIGIIFISPISQRIAIIVGIEDFFKWIIYSLVIGIIILSYSLIVFYFAYSDFKRGIKRVVFKQK